MGIIWLKLIPLCAFSNLRTAQLFWYDFNLNILFLKIYTCHENSNESLLYLISEFSRLNFLIKKYILVKVKLCFSVPSAGIAEIEQT